MFQARHLIESSSDLPSTFFQQTHVHSPLPLRQTETLLGRHDANGVGVAHAAAPALHADDGIALGEHAQPDGVGDAPLQALVHVLLPVDLIEVGLLVGEEEGIDAAIEVGVLSVLVDDTDDTDEKWDDKVMG